MSKFKPIKYYRSIFDVDFEKLKEQGIKVVACDLDNTLVPHDVTLPTKEVSELVKKVNDLGMKFIILSNNKEQRVQTFADPLNIDYYFSSRKPLKKNFLRLMHDNHITNKQLCLIGDQLMTDVYGANKLGIMSIFVEPLANKDIFYTKVNRLMEKKVLKKLVKKQMFKEGQYYD